MAKSTAISQLTDQIETIRKEAYTEGYAAAMKAVADFTNAKPAAKTPRAARAVAAVIPPAEKTPRRARAAKPAPRKRLARGENANLVIQALTSRPEHTGKAADIRRAIKEQHEIELPFISIRHALGQLQTQNKVTVDGDGKTWHLAAAA